MSNTARNYATLGVLVLINALNYMDRFTVAGVLTLLEKEPNSCQKCPICCCGLGINDSQGGFLTTSFILSYTIFSLFFGYAGDRYSRRILIGIGILIWSCFTLVGSFANSYNFLLAMRSLVGIGEASYGTIAPTIIADLFPKETRMRMLSFFYLATPVGSALGYIIGTTVAHSLGCWKWAFRVTPGLGLICALLCFFLIKDPVRGQSDTNGFGENVEARGRTGVKAFFADILHILRCKSFLWSTLGFSAMSFVVGGVAQWGPTYIMWGSGVAKGVNSNGTSLGYSQGTASIGFGAVAVVAGIGGVLFGAEAARRWSKTNPQADALICALGLISGAPLLFFFLVLADVNLPVTWVLGVIGETLLMVQWAPVAAILLYVIVPEKRSLAEAIQILFIHLLGDAFSPFIIGSIADHLRDGPIPDLQSTSVVKMRKEFFALQYSLYMTAFVAVIGSGCFFVCSFYLKEDGEAAKKIQPLNENDSTRLIADDYDNKKVTS